jgi:hypothetical protein
MAHLDRGHFGAGRRRFGGAFFGDGFDCPYGEIYAPYDWPNACSY